MKKTKSNHKAKPRRATDNQGQSSQGRGTSHAFSASMSDRSTGYVGKPRRVANGQKNGDHVRVAKDPRLA